MRELVEQSSERGRTHRVPYHHHRAYVVSNALLGTRVFSAYRYNNVERMRPLVTQVIIPVLESFLALGVGRCDVGCIKGLVIFERVLDVAGTYQRRPIA